MIHNYLTGACVCNYPHAGVEKDINDCINLELRVRQSISELTKNRAAFRITV